MVFDFVFSSFLANFNNFVDEKYILSDNAFVRRGKWNLETAIKFPLFNRGCPPKLIFDFCEKNF